MITSAGAAEVYDLEPDTVPKLSFMASGYDVAVASTEAQMDELLADLGLGVASPGLYTLGYWLNSIRAGTANISNAFLSSGGVFFNDGYFLDADGDRFYGMGYLSITEILQLGFLGLSTNIKSLSSSFNLSSLVTAVNTNTTAVNSVVTAVNNNKSAVDLVRVAVNNTTSAVDYTTAAVNGTTAAVEDTTAAVEDTTAAVEDTTAAVNVFSTNFSSFYSDFLAKAHISVSSPYLTSNGVSASATYPISFSALLSNGFLGLSYSINGKRGVRDYSGSLIDNQNITSTFSATGLGPMLQRYLEEIQHDSGLLTYIFASPEDIEMKENSSSSMSAINDSFIDPDSDTSVSVSDIGTLSSAAGSIESFGATGVTPDQAFAQLGNDSIFEFFSQTTADNLDSRPSSYSLRDPAPQIVTNYYSESRAEFFNLIGEGSE